MLVIELAERVRLAEIAKTSAVSGGQPLSPEQRAFFEPRFGADFSRVRIHADDTADAAARAVGALAYARGSDIVFQKVPSGTHMRSTQINNALIGIRICPSDHYDIPIVSNGHPLVWTKLTPG